MKCLLCARQLPNTKNITLLFIELTRTTGFSKIFWNVEMNFLELENAYLVKNS